VTAVPPDATSTLLISIEVYWARTAGGFGDWPEEDEWNVIYEGEDVYPDSKGFYMYFKVNATILLSFHRWVEVSIKIERLQGYASSNSSNQGQTTSGFQTEYWDDIGNLATATVCVNTTEGEYYYNRRIFKIDFPVASDTTTTPATTTTDTTTTSTTTTTTISIGEDQAMTDLLPLLAGVGVIAIIAVAALARRRTRPGHVIPPDPRVLIVCPYCGAKTEQGLLKCQNCSADL